VMRIRCSKGMKISRFHGNFFIRGKDLLALPNVTRDSSYTVELEHDSEAIGTPVVYVQSALLYTTSTGERRIRVHTLAVPVATKTEDLTKSVDMDTMCNLIAKKASEVALKKGLTEARKACEETCVSILRGSRPNSAAFSQGLQDVSPKLQLLALYMQSLQKNSMLRGGAEVCLYLMLERIESFSLSLSLSLSHTHTHTHTHTSIQVPSDQRAYLLHRVCTMHTTRFTNIQQHQVPITRVNIFPRMYALHSMPATAGLPAKDGQVGESSKNICMPPFMHLALNQISANGVYLLEDGLDIWLWFGRASPSGAATSLFGVNSLDGVDTTQLRLVKRPKDSMNARINAICDAIRDGRSIFQRVHCVRQGDALDRVFQMRLVEDRAHFPGGQRSYAEFAGHMQKLTKLKIPH